jgi:hypothetical protein
MTTLALRLRVAANALLRLEPHAALTAIKLLREAADVLDPPMRSGDTDSIPHLVAQRDAAEKELAELRDKKSC